MSTGVLGNLTPAQLQYLNEQATAIGLNPGEINSLTTTPLSDFSPSLQSKVQADVTNLQASLNTPQAQARIAQIQAANDVATNQNNIVLEQQQATATSETASNQIDNTAPTAVVNNTSPTTLQENTNITNPPKPASDLNLSNAAEPAPEGVLSGVPWTGGTGTFTGSGYSPDFVDYRIPLTNVLHQYPSYTYGLSLALLNTDEYNNVVNTGTYTPNRVLIASAGRYNNTPGANQFIRSPYFSQDFYFEDLNMTTIIGTNAHSRNTNAIEFRFTIIEPYGMTLINRLLDQANDPEVNAANYLDMVYVLQIDFFASDETGTIVGIIPGITKVIPIKLTQMNITASVTGATYQINAVPYNSLAFTQTTVSTPANFEIAASSVGEFFSAGNSGNKSFADALNGWNTGLANSNKIGVADTYNFNIDPRIAQAGINTGSALSSRDTTMANPQNTTSIRQSNLGQASTAFNHSVRTMSINAGTSIDKVIDYVMRNSSYITGQMTIPDGVDPQTYLTQKAQNANQPLNWYKIVPTVTVGNFDPIRNVTAKNYTYSVQPYTIYNVKSDVAPQGKAVEVMKEYNYIYTGKNDDIITFDLTFNTLYYTAQTAYRSAVASLYKSSDTTATAQNNNNQNSGAYQGSNQAPGSVMPMQVKPQVYNAKARATGGSISPVSVAVADLEDSLMTLSAADMLNVQLTIVGDPQFIKQDDCFFSPLLPTTSTNSVLAGRIGVNTVGDPRLTPNGSIRTDYTEIYVRLMFKTPTDVDESTGLIKFNSNYKTSIFSGLYKILQVTSDFKNGQFTQILNLIRLPYQDSYDYGNQPPNSNIQRNSDITPESTTAYSNPNMQDVPIPPPPPAAEDGAGPGVSVPPPPPGINLQQQNLINLNSVAPTLPIAGSGASLTDPFEGKTYTGSDSSLNTNAAAKLLGGQ